MTPLTASTHRRPRYEYRAALITGATSGIGRAFARSLPETTTLVLTGRDEAALEELRQELAHSSRAVLTVAADLAVEAGREAVREAAERAGIDLFINNAGRGGFGAFLESPAEELEQTLTVDVVAPTLLLCALLPGMIARAKLDGHRAGLIDTVSTAAFVPVPQLAAYAAAKAYLLSLTEALRAELAREPVDILALCPGPVRTAFGRRAGFAQGFLPGAVSPEHVASTALAALGRRGVVFTDPFSRATLAPLVRLRAATARTLHEAIRLGGRLWRRRAPADDAA